MCYYELNLIEASISGIDSFNHHLQNSGKLNPRNKSLSKYFIDFYRDLIKLKLKPHNISDISLRKISKKLEEKEFTYSDRWVYKKLQELKLLKGNESVSKKKYLNKHREIKTG